MPYYLSSKKIPTRVAEPGRPLNQGWVPVGCHPDDCAKEDRKWIWLSTLSDHALVLLRNLNGDKDLDLLADFGRERISPSTRNKLDHYLGDRNVEDANFNDVISNVFRDPPVDGRWGKPLQANRGRGRYEIHLQLPDDPLVFWEGASSRRGKSTVTLTDTFSRADGDLNGSTISGGGGVWSETAGTGLAVVAGELKTATHNNGGWYNALITSDLDTTNMYAQLDMTFFPATNSTADVCVRVVGANTAVGSEGYYLEVNRSGVWEVRNWFNDDTLDSGTSTLSLPDTIYLEIDGSTWTWKFNGATVDTGTHTAWTASKRVGVAMFDGGISNNVRADNFIGGDLTAGAPTSLDVYELGLRQSRSSMNAYEAHARRRSY